MLRSFLKIIIPIILLAGILAAAKYMDTGRYEQATQENPIETTVAAEQTETAQTEDPAQTQPEETQTEETQPEETQTEETQTEETQPEETQPEPDQTQETLTGETQPSETETGKTSYVLTLMGDCTFGATETAYFAKLGYVKTVGENYAYPFENVITYLENDDFTILNLEGPLCDEGNPRGERFSFRGPSSFVNILTQNSVEMVSLANNHTMDFGQDGYDATKRNLEASNVSYVEQNSAKIITLEGGLTVGLYATVYTKVDKNEVLTQISAMKEQGVDLVIYAPHWGVEGSYDVTPEQRQLAHDAINAGADIVYGSHPHVLEPIEEYNGGIIYYSMGNFSFGGNTNPRDMDTALIQQEVIREEDGTVRLGAYTIIPCSVSSVTQYNNYQPTPYEPGTESYERVMEKLSGTFTGANLPIG